MKRTFRARDYEPRPEIDLADELQAHRELKIEDLMARGLSREAAEAEAREKSDNPEEARARIQAAAYTRSRLRRQSTLAKFETLSRDVRYSFRRMAQGPGFTLIAVLSLTIGIGANTAVFSVVNGLFLRPPPFDEPEDLVQIWTGLENEAPSSDPSWKEFESLREVDGVFDGVGAFDGVFAGLRDSQGTRSAFVEAMTSNLFPMLGIRPILGRSFLPDEGTSSAGDPLAILGYDYWTQAYEADRKVLGETIRLSGIPHTIVGVAPPDLSALQTRTIVTEVFVPMNMARFLSGRTGPDGLPLESLPSVKILGRLAPGVSREAAEVRISGIVKKVRSAGGLTTREGWGFRLWPLQGQAIEPEIDAGLARVAVFLMVVAGLVLLLACTNLANLFLARGVSRKKELALRLALGAGRGRLTGQLFTETAILSLLGGMGGFFLAQWTLDLLFRFQPEIGVTFALDTAADMRVLLFTLGVVSLSSFLFGLVPALAVTRSEITPVLKGVEGTRRGRGLRLRGGLVALQMAVSIILLTGSSLFFHSLLLAQRVDPGFRPDHAVMVQVDLGSGDSRSPEWSRMVEEIRLGAQSEMGIQALGVSDALPLLNRNTVTVSLPGVDPPEGRTGYSVSRYRIDEGYLDAMGIPLLAGRGILESDKEGAGAVVLVNRFSAQRFWPHDDPLGKEVSANGRDYRVVGVVGDVKVQFLSDPPEATFYFSLDQIPASELFIVARGSVETGEMLTSLRRALLEMDPELMVLLAQSMKDRIGINLYPVRLAAAYLGTFGLMALLLAAIGLYGVVSLSVSRRTREVGIRMSIGADAGSVVAMVLKGSLRSVAIGAVLGLGLAMALARLIQSFLFGVAAADPATLVAVPLVLGSVAVLAAFVPARRASRVDPVEALRTE